jgi:transposase
MAQKHIDMNQAKQIQQLSADGVAIKEIVRRTGISRKTVRKYLRKIESIDHTLQVNVSQPIPANELAAIIYNNDSFPILQQRFEALIKHFDVKKDSLHKTGVTKQLLWVEYLTQNPDGYKYSQYCYLFKKYLNDSDPAFHWEYSPAEFTQIDFAGKKLSYVDKSTGEMIPCQIFVATLPYSGLIFSIAVHSQKTADFSHCINEMVKYIGGVTKTILCDNLKTAVTRADKHEPLFTVLCHQLSAHYNTTFSATRPHEPRDKAMVEKAVNIIYTNIYGPLYNEVPGSLEALNNQIRRLLNTLNLKPYKGSSDSRRDIFERQEKSLLKQLPDTPYSLRKCKLVTVQRNYAIQLPDNKHYYTVPYQYVGYKVQVYFDIRTVEVYHQHQRISFHVRSSTEPQFNRINEHMPASHQHMLDSQGWTVEDLLKRAEWVGPYTRQTADRILHGSIYPEQNYKTCNTMLLLQNRYTKQRLEAACLRAANVQRPTLKMIRNILETGLDKQPMLFDIEEKLLPAHANIRGSKNYQ